MTDPRPLLHRALDQMGAVVDHSADLDAPSPCEGWDVRTLLDHVVAVHRRIARAPAGTALEADHVEHVADDDHARVLERLRTEITDAWADDAVLDRTTPVPWGREPGRQVALGFTQELVVHAWDLAVVDGRADTLDPALADAVLAPIRHVIPAEDREHMPFGEVVEVPDDADAYDRLVAWLGRDPDAVRSTMTGR
jgi:uncharacterized protein (TIGR03086 family)